jgi:S-phase kinase-associated protein 1
MAEATLTLVCKEGDKVTVGANFQEMSALVKNIVEDSGLTEEIPLEQVTKPVLDKIIEYCVHHEFTVPEPIAKPLQSNNIYDAVSQWDGDYISAFDEDTLIELIKAANYLDIKCLLDLGLARIAAKFKGKTVEELRTEYNIQEEFTTEVEE